jgi:hypothetical protein
VVNGERYHWLSNADVGEPGREPGVNVGSRRDEKTYEHMRGRARVTVSQMTDFALN